MDKYSAICPIVSRHCNWYSQGIKFTIHGDCDTDYRHPKNTLVFREGHDINYLVHDLGDLNYFVVFCDVDTKEALQYVGKVTINFNDVDIIKKGTFDAIDGLKILKTEFGYCKGSKQMFHPLEGTGGKQYGYSDDILLFADSYRNLFELNDLVCAKIREIDSSIGCEFDFM